MNIFLVIGGAAGAAITLSDPGGIASLVLLASMVAMFVVYALVLSKEGKPPKP